MSKAGSMPKVPGVTPKAFMAEGSRSAHREADLKRIAVRDGGKALHGPEPVFVEVTTARGLKGAANLALAAEIEFGTATVDAGDGAVRCIRRATVLFVSPLGGFEERTYTGDGAARIERVVEFACAGWPLAEAVDDAVKAEAFAA